MRLKPKNGKHFLWLPYVSAIDIKGRTASFTYQGGVETIGFHRIHSIMFYGSVIDLSQKFLEICTQYKIPVTIHRRNMSRATWIAANTQTGVKDILSRQILFRENEIKQAYIARSLVKAKFKAASWLMPHDASKLTGNLSVEQIRNVEAVHARLYWEKYFAGLGYPNWVRRGKNPISQTLDAVSKYLHGIFLRWILYHHISPYHGYLHVQTEYPSLIYDFMEPYRGYFDLVAFKTIKKCQAKGKGREDWLPATINELKSFLYTKVYTDATRQIVTVSELLHGIVLAFRSYLLGDTNRFIIPMPGNPNGGRPKKTGYRLYGRQAGRTDFWTMAELVHKQSRRQYLDPKKFLSGKD